MARPTRSAALDWRAPVGSPEGASPPGDRPLTRAAAGIGLLLPLLAGGNYFITFDPNTAMTTFSLAVIGFVGISWSGDRADASASAPGAAPLAVFLSWWWLNFVARPIGPHAAIDALGIFCGIVLYGCLSRLSIRSDMIRSMVWGLAAGTSLTAFYAFYQHWVVIPRLAEWMPAHGLDAPYRAANANFYSGNCYAPFVAAVILLGSGVIYTTSSGAQRFAMTLLVLPCLVALIFAKSRAAVVLLLLSALALSLPRRSSRHGSRWRLLGWLVAAVTALGLLALLATDVRELVWVSIGGRLSIWRAALAMAFDHWLLGVGLGRFGEFFPDYQITDYFTRYPHNLLLELFAEAGVVGVGAFLAFIVFTLRSFRSDAARADGRSDERRDLASFCHAAFALLLAHSMVDIDWRAPANPILLFLLAALNRR